MKQFRMKRHSIAFRLTVFVTGLLVFQAFLMTGILVVTGVLKEANLNAYASFQEKVDNRRSYIESEMKNRWTNLEPFIPPISKTLTHWSGANDLFFEEISSQMIAMLRATQATGVFVVLNEPQDQRYPSLYFRDYDPKMNHYSNNDLYMIVGPPDIARALSIPLDQTWQYQLKLSDDNRSFYHMPLEASTLTSQSRLLGYWAKPFKLADRDLDIITYSMPLFDEENVLRGIIGIEITLNYLTHFLPATDLQARDSLGYVIAKKSIGEASIQPVVTTGALQNRLMDLSKPLALTSVEEEKNIFKVEAHSATEPIYASIEKLNLYAYNTPFEEQEWYLVAFMKESDLLSYSISIRRNVFISLALVVGIGIFGSVIFSYRFSRPIIRLAQAVTHTGSLNDMVIEETGIYEVDELSKAILNSATRLSRIIDLFEVPIGAFEVMEEAEHVFVTEAVLEILDIQVAQASYILEKEQFGQRLEDILSRPEPHETDVYRLYKDEDRWVKVKITTFHQSIIGIVMDVTEEIHEKLIIKKDRDLDPLTKLLNRKAFQYRFENWYAQHTDEASALIMFDLDNLKSINDTYGHKWGDHYITEVVRHLSGMAPPSHMLLARRSGDEFVVLLHGYRDREALLETLHAFFHRLQSEKIIFPDTIAREMMISGGLMWVVGKALTYDELLHFADEALYDAKKHNKGFYAISQMEVK